jgi:hypothetical protein
MTPKAFHALFGRIGSRAKMQFPIHPHMLRHGCGYALANAGHDTRALQAWLGHKNTRFGTRSLRRTGSRTSGANRAGERGVEKGREQQCDDISSPGAPLFIPFGRGSRIGTAAVQKRSPHACGGVRNVCCDVSALTTPVFNPSTAPLPPPKPAMACTS